MVGLGVVLVGVGVGSFAAVRLLTGGSGPATAEAIPTPFPEPPGPDVTPIPGTTPDTTEPWWYVPYLNAARDKPLMDGMIAGVNISPAADPGRVCPTGEKAEGTFADTVGGPLSLSPRFLPQGAEEASNVLVGLCDGEPVTAEATYLISPDPSVPRYGGSVVIFRHAGEPVAALAIPRERWHEAMVGNHAAAVAEPILSELGLGESAVVIHDNGVLTELHADGIPMGDVLKIAAGLF